MLRFFVDEDLPRSLSDDLKVAGFQAEHVQETDLHITLGRAIVKALSAMNSTELLGHLIVVEPGRVRIRKVP